MGWDTIIWWVVSSVISYALTPKPQSQDARSASLDEFALPIASESASIPVVFGTRWVLNPNVVWYGDYKQVPIMSDSGGKKG